MATTNESAHLEYWSSCTLESVLCKKRSHHNEKLVHHIEEWPLLTTTRESPGTATRPHYRQKYKQISFKKKQEKERAHWQSWKDFPTGVSGSRGKELRASILPCFSSDSSQVTIGRYFKWTMYMLVFFNLQVETH